MTAFPTAAAAPLALLLLVAVAPRLAGADGVKPAPPQPVEQVVQFRVEHDCLTVRTSVPPTNGMVEVELENLAGTARVDAALRSLRNRPGGALFFKFTHTGPTARGGNGADAGAPGESTDTNLFVRPGYVQLNRVARGGGEMAVVSLSQTGEPGDPLDAAAGGDDRVTLRVRRMVVVTGEVTEEFTRSAPSFVELLRRHPHEAAEHLAPVFRDFRQEAEVLGADTRVAWQVLSARLPRDPAVAREVEALVAQLDADRYQEREAATRRLRELGGPATLVLSDLPRGRYSVEQNSRIDAALAAFRPLSDQAAAGRLKDTEFLLGCLAYSDDPLIRAGALRELERSTGRPLNPPPADREKRLRLVRELRESLASTPSR